MRFLLAALLLSLTAAPVLAQAQQPKPIAPEQLDAALEQVDSTAELERLALQLHGAGEHAQVAKVWKRLASLRPHIGRYRLNEAAAYAEQGLRSETYNALLGLQNQGYAFRLGDDARFEKVGGTEVWDYIVEGFDTNAVPFGEGGVVHTLPREDLLLESLAWDPKRKQLLVGSAREGKVYLIDESGEIKPLVSADDDNGMWAVFDIAVDAERRVLWVASTAVPHYREYDAEQDLGRAGIFKFDLDSGKFLKKFLSPTMAGQSFFMSTLAVAGDGAVFAADGVNNAVYQVRDDSFSRLFHAPRLTSIRGLATSADSKILYFADHQLGLFGFSLDDGKPFDIPSDSGAERPAAEPGCACEACGERS
jgi:hypothetical protein